MKFTKSSVVLSTAVLLGSALTGLAGIAGTAQAADSDQALNGVATSGQENGAEQGVDPKNNATAGKGTAESYAGIGFNAGDLVLNQVPNFDFGSSNDFMTKTDFSLFSAGADLPYTTTQAAAEATRPRALILTDARGTANVSGAAEGDPDTKGTNGWNVTVNFETLMSDGTDNLGTAGADKTAAPILQLSSKLTPTPVTYDSANSGSITPGTVNDDSTSPLYTGKAPVLATTDTTDFLDVPSSSTDPVKVMNADQTQGLRGWAVNYQDKDSVHLQVPIEQQSIGVFTAKLNWTLGNAPA